jgi:hypothetical protein
LHTGPCSQRPHLPPPPAACRASPVPQHPWPLHDTSIPSDVVPWTSRHPRLDAPYRAAVAMAQQALVRRLWSSLALWFSPSPPGHCRGTPELSPLLIFSYLIWFLIPELSPASSVEEPRPTHAPIACQSQARTPSILDEPRELLITKMAVFSVSRQRRRCAARAAMAGCEDWRGCVASAVHDVGHHGKKGSKGPAVEPY